MLRSQCDSLTLFQRQTTSNRCTYHQTYSKTKKEGPVFPIHALLVALGSEDTNGIELVFVYFFKKILYFLCLALSIFPHLPKKGNIIMVKKES